MNDGILPNGSPARFAAAAVPLRVTTITTPGAGTFTKQARTRWLRVKRLGGGGGGGNNQSGGPAIQTAWGGKAGAYCEDWLEATATSYAYSVGAGGAGGSGGASGGGNGGDTTFAGLLAAPGGAGGASGATTTTAGNSSVGESSPYGGGGKIDSVAPPGRGYGSGGGVSFNTSAAGAAGAGGLIIVEEY